MLVAVSLLAERTRAFLADLHKYETEVNLFGRADARAAALLAALQQALGDGNSNAGTPACLEREATELLAKLNAASTWAEGTAT